MQKFNASSSGQAERAPQLLNRETSHPIIKNAPESLTARLNRISLLLLADDGLISSSFMAQSRLVYCYQPRAAHRRHGDNA